jgi:L-alanine-DL-glutamate epimerase-like enolase superfamily enzyme
VGHFVRSRSIDGAEGVALCSERVGYLIPILTDRVAPYFVGKDARELERLIDGVYVHESNYKLAGMPFWICVAWVELSLLDLLGKIAEKSAGALLGPVLRTEIPVYLSSLRRDTTPEREVEWIAPRLEATGARAVKIKVGGRMSRNADAAPGRTEKLVALARDTFGPDVALMADANGSYDAARGIEVGRRLQDLGYAFFEEPCPFEELEETKRVADALDMTVAGGEQDASLPRFDWMARNRVVDLLQPDVTYVGGLTRALRVARIAAAAGLKITPHSPSTGAGAVPMLQFASVAPNIGPHQEYRGEAVKPETWHAATIEVRGGTVAVPKGPGLGLDIDPTVFEKASVIGRA